MNRRYGIGLSLLIVAATASHARAQQQKTCPAGTVQVGVTHSTKPDGTPVIHLLCQQQDEPDPPAAPPTRTYTPAGNGFIGGTTWITGYNVQSADPRIVAKEHEMMEQQMRLAGIRYADGIDFNRYDFVLGIAASTDALTDLASRVVFDEYSKGQFSAIEQDLYNSLKDRQFGELACHSNGAMVCLAALKNKDVVADRVTLYGPQITVESLKMWDDMVRSGQLKSVQVYYNQNDPVAPVSLLIGGGMAGEEAPSALAMFNAATLARFINQVSPRLTVRTFPCGGRYPTLDCHAMTAYKTRVTPSTQGVPQ